MPEEKENGQEKETLQRKFRHLKEKSIPVHPRGTHEFLSPCVCVRVEVWLGFHYYFFFGWVETKKLEPTREGLVRR